MELGRQVVTIVAICRWLGLNSATFSFELLSGVKASYPLARAF
jgi:hypothetical protein